MRLKLVAISLKGFHMGSKSVVIAVHGGAGAPRDYQDRCEAAARVGLVVLMDNGQALEAVVESVTAMEDDGRFNAGKGAALRMDGRTIEMDAAVMDSTGALGAVACIQRVKNPVLVARAVSDTPHWLLTGEGALRFAQQAGLAGDFAPSDEASANHDDLMQALVSSSDPDALATFARHWNYATPWVDAVSRYSGDTVGAIALDSDGNFAVATSTGGSPPSLLGRVGDTPIIGCGFFAGVAGAVAVTGLGEQIVRQMLSHKVYQWIEQGVPLHAAIDRGIALFNKSVDVGIIAINDGGAAAGSNREMPTSILENDEGIVIH
jgi:L-asparaginase/beta-aspartyl-peptidase (threonine type)